MAAIRAAGFVLYRREAAGLAYLTLVNARHGDVGVPKGKVEPGEEPLRTALRETEEETGLRPPDLAPNPWFRRVVRYPVAAGEKEVTYLLAEARTAAVRLSPEHASGAWMGLDAARAAVPHENLRAVLQDAAVFLKDPCLRRGLDPAAARALLVRHVGAGAPVVRHSALVARVAREIAEAAGGVDAEFVEAAAWVHDIGRARTMDDHHPLEGFRLLVAEGHAGYAPPCLSHFCKGASFAELGDTPLMREMWEACDLSTFERCEQVIALADFHAAGDRRVTLEERHADLVRRYGPSEFLDRNLQICRSLANTLRGGGP